MIVRGQGTRLITPETKQLAALLQNRHPMPVTQVSEPIAIEAICVDVIPPGKHLLVTDG
jgi:hypothetical protein